MTPLRPSVRMVVCTIALVLATTTLPLSSLAQARPAPAGGEPTRAAAAATIAYSPSYSTDVSADTRFTVSWTASESAGLAFDVQSRAGLNGLWTDWMTATTATAATFSGVAGKTYYFRARALDGTSTVGAWSPVNPSTVVPHYARVAGYRGPWGTVTGAELYGGRSRYTTRRGASASLSFVNARALSLVVTQRPDGGYADVYIGGRKIRRIDFYAATTRTRVRLLLASYRLPTAGTLRVVATHKRNARSRGFRVEVNGFGVLSGTRRIYGVDTALGSLVPSQRQKALGMLRSAGSRWVRAGIYWPWIDRHGKAQRDWSVSDAYITDALAHDQTVIGGLLGYAGWANGHPSKPYYVPADTREFANFCRDAVTRYKDRVHYWEVWSEPNGPFWTDARGRSKVDARAYARMLRRAYLAIKSVDPSAKVIFGGIDRNHYSYLKTAYSVLNSYPDARANNRFFDILGSHPYCDNRSPSSTDYVYRWRSMGMDRNFTGLPGMKRVMNSYGDRRKHVIITEFGWSTKDLHYTRGVSYATQARYLRQAYRMLQRWTWVDAALWYGFKDYEWWDEGPFSLINRDFSTRPSYRAYRDEANR